MLIYTLKGRFLRKISTFLENDLPCFSSVNVLQKKCLILQLPHVNGFLSGRQSLSCKSGQKFAQRIGKKQGILRLFFIGSHHPFGSHTSVIGGGRQKGDEA